MIETLGSPWLHLIFWTFAAAMALSFNVFMKGANIGWTFISIGVLLIGFRLAFKLLPIYEQYQFIRYVISIIGLISLFIGLMIYCHTTVKSFRG